ncbi:MAG: hypothetical protein ABIL16_04855 [candidate division WOR-3 bacterium]
MENAKEIWEILKEVGKRLDDVGKRLDDVGRRLDSVGERLDRLAKSQEETDKKLRELAESQKETDKMLKETRKLVESLAKRQEETDKKIKELAERQAETDEQIKVMSKKIEEIAIRVDKTTTSISQLNGLWQNYTEETIREGLEYALKELGFKGFYLEEYRKRKDMEVDALAVGKDYVIVVEVKTTLKKGDVDEFEERLKNKFLKVFYEYKGFRLYGAVAGMRIQKGIDRYASKKGLIVLKHKDGKDVKVLNPKNFKPKDFSGL